MAFQKLKDAMRTAPILTIPNFQEPFILELMLLVQELELFRVKASTLLLILQEISSWNV